MNVDVISKATGAATQVSSDAIDLDAPSIVRLDLTRAEVAGFNRDGRDLIIRLTNGEQIRVRDFYAEGDSLPNDLVLREGDGTQWLARPSAGTPRFSLIKDLDELMAAQAEGGGSALSLPAMLGGLAAAGGLAVAAGGGGGDDDDRAAPPTGPGTGTGTVPDRDPPPAPTADVSDNGMMVTGRGEPGATVTIRTLAGAVVGTGVVADDGTYAIPLSDPQTDGEAIIVTQTDRAGNTSGGAQDIGPDLTPPPAPSATVEEGGAAVTGVGQPGATVTVRDSAGNVLGTATVAPDGSYSVTLPAPLEVGDTVSVTQTDAAGNTSAATTATALDLTAPIAPTATVSDDGTAVTGRGEPGATILVSNVGGNVIATTVVAEDGSYSAPLDAVQSNGQPLTVTETDSAGNVSSATPITAPDSTAPAAPTVAISDDGTAVTGTGEAGGQITVTNEDGLVVGSVTVGGDGSFTVPLAPPQGDGGTVSVVLTDPAGNQSPTVSVTVPDVTAPDAPTVAIDDLGTQVSGSGEPGASVTVTGPGGTTLATTVIDDLGSYAVTITTPLLNGERVEVRQADAAGNVSQSTAAFAPDRTAPAQPSAIVAPDGTAVSGAGEPGAQITVTDAAGTVVGTATVTSDGSFEAPLGTAQANGEVLVVRQVDAAGNAAPPLTIVAPDVVGPAAPVAAIDATGTIVSGSGEAGAVVIVSDGAGAELGRATVDARGDYAVVLGTPVVDGGTLAVVQVDSTGNESVPVSLTAPDLIAPAAPAVTVAPDGTAVTGSGEVGATVEVRSPLGAVIATTTVGADGSFTAPLAPAQVDGEALSVTQVDAAGNVSPAATATAPDLVAGDRPDAPTAAVAADGTAVTGVAAAGAAIAIYDVDGVPVANGIAAADGSYSVAVTPPLVNGETVRVVQADAEGDVSPPATALAPDLTAPAAPGAALDEAGSVVTGSAESGAAILVRAEDGTVLGSGTANVRGDFAIVLAQPQLDGGTIAVSQTDAAGNESTATVLTADDVTAPPAPSAAVTADGAAVAGIGEPGSIATVRDSIGTVLGSAPVGADGTYAVPLAPPRVAGEPLSVTLTDAAGNVSPTAPATAPDLTAPSAPTAIVSGDGALVSGRGEPGATVTVAAPSGAVVGSGTVGSGGSYVIPLTPAQANSEALSVTQVDGAGNVSAPVFVTAPDVTAPAAPAAIVSADGTAVSGTGEPGAAVTVTDALGVVVGRAVVDAAGAFVAPLAVPQTDGQALSVAQVDRAGNESPDATAVAPDLFPPEAPTAAISADGAIVTGTGEPGAQIAVTDAAGTVLGSATVAADGRFEAGLIPAQANGQALSVVQTDAAGNASAALALTAPDITAPAAPAATLDASGTEVSGTGEPGATVTVRDAGGAVLGVALVDARGDYAVVLDAPSLDGTALSVVQVDAAGNASPPTALVQPDLTAPAAPSAAVSADGAAVTGIGEPGATITVRSPLGVVIGGATVAADGTYAAALSPAQVDGEALLVTQADAAGNVSPTVNATAPDLVADTNPDAPSATVSADGAAVTGVAAGGATITVYDVDGRVIATGASATDGSYAVVLTPPRVAGEIVRVTQTDADGDVSPPATAIAPDLTAPAAPTAVLDPTGAAVTGAGEPGARIEVRGADGGLLGSATVNARGSYAVALTPTQANGETVAVTQVDAAGNVSPPITLIAADLTAPAAPQAVVTPDGAAVTGTGEVGASVVVRNAAGAVIGSGTVAANGAFTVPVSAPLLDGQRVAVTLGDAAGNTSAPVTIVAPDVTAPPVPTAAIAGDGTLVTGTGQAGATVSVTAGGIVVGTATVAPDGAYVVRLAPPQANGQALSVSQADAAGNASAARPLTAPDITDPAAPTVAVAANGAQATGTGEPGASITIVGATGATIGSAIVAADGSYVALLTPPQLNGEVVTATQTDAAGNVSPTAQAVAPDTTSPAAPTLVIAADGTSASGIAEAGAAVTLRNPDGSTIATVVADAGGSYSVPLAPARVDGELLSVVQRDGAGNLSPAASALAPDLGAPTSLTAVVAADGSAVTGAGEVGATVTIRDPAGVVIGSAVVAADGSYAAPLSPPQVNGETVTATQTTPAGNTGSPVQAVAPDLTLPAAPTADVTADGTAVVGTGEPGATVTVSAPGGAIVGSAVVAADGSYTAPLTPVQGNGGTLSVVQADPTGNASPPTAAPAPDFTVPLAPTLTINGDGTMASGTGEPGTTVTVTGPGNVILGTAPVASDGSYAMPLSPAQINGQALSATQADAAGNVSPAATANAPDLVVPLAPTAIVSADGASVSGSGEAGARVLITDAAGDVLGAATVAVDGSYTAVLTTPQINGEPLLATQTDGGGNVSPATAVTAPDLTDPAVPTLTIAADGASASGTGEPGATITLANAGGGVVGTTIVGTDGSYSIALVPPRLNGEAFVATQADPAGNISPQASAAAPDLTPPAAPVVVAVSPDGASLTGTGEAGARVSVSGPAGVLGTTVVAPDGSFTVPLSPAQDNGQPLSVVQTDAAGNASPAATLAAPDNTAPAAPTIVVAVDGASVSGVGEPGATVTITAPGGGVIGTAVVAADGSYVAPLTTPQLNGEVLTARQTDPAGNGSATSSALAPDSTAPLAPTATVAVGGGFVTGTGEPGATVSVTGPAGALGSAIVRADGTYTVPLSAPQRNGESLAVAQTDTAGNASPATTVVAADTTSPLAPVAAVSADGTAVVGTGLAGATITVSGPGGGVIGSAIVTADGSYAVPLTTPQRNGEVLSVVQSDAAGNASPPVPAIAPDLTAPSAPSAAVGGGGDVVTGAGEPGATVTITGPGGAVLGSALVGAGGSYLVTLGAAQRNGEALVATQRDAAGNVSGGTPAIAPDLTAPAAPTALTVSPAGTTLTGTGEPGAMVEVRTATGTVLGRGPVAADGSFSIGLVPAQIAGTTLSVTQADRAGNVSPIAPVVAPFDITAFGNVDDASIDLTPVTRPVDFGTANYLALVSLGLLDLDATVLGTPSVQFTVEDGHSLDAVFTYDALLNLGVASGYAVVVQRFDGTNWVAVGTAGDVSLLNLGLLNGNLSATGTFGPGEYRAFLTFDGTLGAGVLGTLNVAGTDSDFTDIAAVVPSATTGNVVTDAGPAGQVDVVSPGTQVTSVTVDGISTAVTAAGTVVDGAWGTLIINPDGSYTYTPDASASAIGQTDVFTYTLLDPTDGELESANLSIIIGSPDVTGAPIAVADVAVADVTYENVVTTTPTTTAFTFNSSTSGLSLVSSGGGGGGFSVVPGGVADVTITAVRAPGLALLPSYTLTVRDGAGGVAYTRTATAVAGLPVGTGVVFTVDDLPAGNYTYTVTSSALVTSFGTTVTLGSTTTFAGQYRLATAEDATGNLLDNDTANTSFAAIRVDAGTGLAEIGDTPAVLTGRYGTLTIDEAGDYLYRPSATLAYSTVDLVDSFTYQLVQPNGTAATATLNVTIDVPADGPAAAAATVTSFTLAPVADADAIPLDAFTAQAAPADGGPEGAAISLATYDLFEGQGEIDQVLSHYLEQQQGTAEAQTPAATTTPALDPMAAPAMDPLSYLTTFEDTERNAATHNQAM